MLVGTETGDDAGVYLLPPNTEDLGLVQTVDLIAPLCDDPETFGRIAAANALSDVYAMGGQPVSALNVCVFPKALPTKAAQAILAGAHATLKEAGAVLLGGHTVRGPELLFGLAVTGLVSPKRIWRNVGAQVGDVLILTKPLGSGLLATAHRRGLLPDTGEWLGRLAELNRVAAQVLADFPVSAATDVTGFGLVGHAIAMTQTAAVSFRVFAGSLPLYEGTRACLASGVTCGGAQNNRAAFLAKTFLHPQVEAAFAEVVFDPQTSGGLLVALPAACHTEALVALQRAGVPSARVGEVISADTHPFLLFP